MIKSIKKLFRNKPSSLRDNRLLDIQYEVGKFSLILPSIHKLPDYQNSFKNYDKQLQNIVSTTIINENQNVVIDIGANVGDTAAFIRTFSDCKIYCIEGDPFYLKYLMRNCEMIPNVIIVDSYVSGQRNNDHFNIVRSSGTSRIDETNYQSDLSELKIDSLENILKQYNIVPEFVKLLKLDTDGMDFKILLDSEYLLRSYHFNLYFEYDLFYDQDALNNSVYLLRLLQEIGYYFIVYDNFGNLMTVITSDFSNRFSELNNYLVSCRKNGGGLFYYDVFASINKKDIEMIYNLSKE